MANHIIYDSTPTYHVSDLEWYHIMTRSKVGPMPIYYITSTGFWGMKHQFGDITYGR